VVRTPRRPQVPEQQIKVLLAVERQALTLQEPVVVGLTQSEATLEQTTVETVGQGFHPPSQVHRWGVPVEAVGAVTFLEQVGQHQTVVGQALHPVLTAHLEP